MASTADIASNTMGRRGFASPSGSEAHAVRRANWTKIRASCFRGPRQVSFARDWVGLPNSQDQERGDGECLVGIPGELKIDDVTDEAVAKEGNDAEDEGHYEDSHDLPLLKPAITRGRSVRVALRRVLFLLSPFLHQSARLSIVHALSIGADRMHSTCALPHASVKLRS